MKIFKNVLKIIAILLVLLAIGGAIYLYNAGPE